MRRRAVGYLLDLLPDDFFERLDEHDESGSSTTSSKALNLNSSFTDFRKFYTCAIFFGLSYMAVLEACIDEGTTRS